MSAVPRPLLTALVVGLTVAYAFGAAATTPFSVAADVVARELVEYLAPGSRGAHPTLSSMADAVDRIFVCKALVFFAWIWLCILIVRSGRAAPGAVPAT